MTITEQMNAAVFDIAERAGVKPTSVKIEFSVTDDAYQQPWTVRIGIQKRSRGGRKIFRDSAYGYSETIERAAAEAILDIAKWEAAGYYRSEPDRD